MGRIKWTEKKIDEMVKSGCGCGTRSGYSPWLQVTSISSLGRSRRVWSPKTGRTHHLLSDVEYALFLVFEWSSDVVDIREQFPLDRDITQDVARIAGFRHPFYPGTDVPTVMTVDFMVTRLRDGLQVQEAFNAKRSEEAEDRKPPFLHVEEITMTICGCFLSKASSLGRSTRVPLLPRCSTPSKSKKIHCPPRRLSTSFCCCWL